MKQVVQDIRGGATATRDVPAPIVQPGHVLVANVASAVSAGTERYVVDLARRSLLGKARQRPDQVRRVLQKIATEGLVGTLQQVRAKLDEPMPLGYATAGVVVECGRGVSEFKPGDRVATAGPHAGVVVVSRNLCARMPEGVGFEQACYASIAAIGLEGVRLSRVTLGERVVVVGLGLIGQICVALLKAQGCKVFGTDVDPSKAELARVFGADEVGVGSPVEAVRRFAGGIGVDAVVITAATPSNEPIEFAAEVARVRGRIVLVGVVGLNLPRPPFFQKELEFTVSASLGPGRWDPIYEEKGVDYPAGQVRWTAQRNMAAVLDVMAAGRLPVERLTSHRFPIERAQEAYELITSRREPFQGIVLQYGAPEAKPQRRMELRTGPASAGTLGVSFIGAGNFARLVLMPTLERVGTFEYRGLCTARGLNAQHTGRAKGFAFATTEAREVLADDRTQVVVVATRHDLHAGLVIEALRAGKHVFVEKPLCISLEELEQVDEVVRGLGSSCPMLLVGLNRRFAPATAIVREFLRGSGPLSVGFRFAPAPLPPDHWTQDHEVGGGRIVGEACHAIDTCIAIIGSPPVKVFAESTGAGGQARPTDDRVFITLRHADGSVSSVAYLAGGDRGFPAERIEAFGEGRTAVIDGWDEIALWRGGKVQRQAARKDKGHRGELETFLASVRAGGAWPVAWEEQRRVAEATLLAVRSLGEGLPLECGA